MNYLPHYMQGLYGIAQFAFRINFASEQVFNKRKNICTKCDHIKNFNEDFKHTKCGLCGCNLLKKLSLNNQQCPRKFWLKEYRSKN